MKLPDIIKRYKHLNVTRSSLYRWMDAHPNLRTAEPDSLRGHTFPRPNKDGRVNVWDEAEVERWFEDNSETIGRQPASIVMTWQAFATAFRSTKEERWTDETTGEEKSEDPMLMWSKVEHLRGDEDDGIQGMDVRVFFETVEDAVLFKLKYY